MTTLLGDDPAPVTSEDTSESDRARYKADMKIIRTIQSAVHGEAIFPLKVQMKRSEVITSGSLKDTEPGNVKTRSSAASNSVGVKSSIADSEDEHDAAAQEETGLGRTAGHMHLRKTPLRRHGIDEEEDQSVGIDSHQPTAERDEEQLGSGGGGDDEEGQGNSFVDESIEEDAGEAPSAGAPQSAHPRPQLSNLGPKVS
jgi:hypothetical protein